MLKGQGVCCTITMGRVHIAALCAFLGYVLLVHWHLTNLTKCDSSLSNEHPLVKGLRGQEHDTSNGDPLKTLSTNPNADNSFKTGVIVLGMHRSGTSIVAGLMTKMGLEVGPTYLLIQPNFDNEKGFFERVDVVLQNDALMAEQNVHYAYNTHKYDHLRALKVLLENKEDGKLFKEGRKALQFLNNPANYPWILKDPRLCITLRTWLPILNSIPAVVLTYRHPLDVAKSLNKREGLQIKRGMKLWLSYNAAMVKNSHDLCRISTSNRLMLSQPEVELQRIYDGLKACGVDVPHPVTQEHIDGFIDPKLQHGKSTEQDKTCETLTKEGSAALDQMTGLNDWSAKTPEEAEVFREAMRFYCALEDGSALSKDFTWNGDVMDH